jgi:GTPase Era involved in 16S rRNA processing
MLLRLKMANDCIIDPLSSLWESDLVLLVHDASDEFSRNKINREILKCLFVHYNKEIILVLNKIDKIENKKILLKLISTLSANSAPKTSNSLQVNEKGNIDVRIENVMKKINLKNQISTDCDTIGFNLNKPHFSNQSQTIVQFQDHNQLNNLNNTSSKSLFLESIQNELKKTQEWHEYYKKFSSIDLDLIIKEGVFEPRFDQVFLTSAYLNSGVLELKEYLISRAKPSKWEYSKCLQTDRHLTHGFIHGSMK